MLVTNRPRVEAANGDDTVSASTPGELSHGEPAIDVPSAPRVALALVVVGQAADTATTLYGLRAPGVYERNPLVAAVVGEVGAVAGLLATNVLAFVLLVLGVELGAQYCRRRGTAAGRVRLLRTASYLLFAAVGFAAAVHNVQVLASA